LSEEYFDPRASAARARRIPIWRWTAWYVGLAIGMFLFYVLLTPLWLGLRWAAWIAEFRARRRRPGSTAGGDVRV
jgi:hypothetical protein